MDDKTLALLGDHEAAERLTERGELLPCPFCGGEAMIEYDTMAPFEYAVFCGDCGVMPAVSENENVVRRIWNTRSPILTPNQLAALRLMEKPRMFEEAKK